MEELNQTQKKQLEVLNIKKLCINLDSFQLFSLIKDLSWYLYLTTLKEENK